MNVKIKSLTPNKNKSKFFGVDYFANVYDGSKQTFKYFGSSIDELMIFRDEMVSFNKAKFANFEVEASALEENSIIGFFQNPDIYSDLESISPILEVLDRYNLGLFIETNSENILNDLDILKEFSLKHPLLIAITINSYQYINISFFDKMDNLESMNKIIRKLADKDLNVGLIFKPMIPRINDEVGELKKIIEKSDSLGVKFIYPSFTLYFDSFKIKNFYDIIEKERPDLRNFYFDKFGFKHSWESQNLNELKKVLVFDSKKNKIKYAMKDIIDLYKNDSYTQLKLF
jgi:DNA repair photolyase